MSDGPIYRDTADSFIATLREVGSPATVALAERVFADAPVRPPHMRQRPVRRPRASVELTQDHAVAILGDLQLLSARFGREDKDLEGRIASLREQIQAAFVEDRR